MKKVAVLTLLVMTILIAGPVQARASEPVGAEFQVNTYTTYGQYYPSVAVNSGGDFVVVWTSGGSYGTDTSGYSIQGQRFDAAGNPAGGEFQVNSFTTDGQYYPSVALDSDGFFVVVWNSDGSYGTDASVTSIQGQLYNASGTPVGGQFQVNSYTTGSQIVPAVAADSQGDLVVVWTSNGSYGTDTSGRSIQGQRYDGAGNPVGGQFQVNSYTTGTLFAASVAVEPDGDFVVVWDNEGSYGSDDSDISIQGQRFDAEGNPVGSQFQVNSYTTGPQYAPDVGVDAQGNFVVVWESDGSHGTDTSGYSIQGQRFDEAGNPVGGQFQVNSYTTGGQVRTTVAVNPEGTFIVAWFGDGSYDTDTDDWSIQAQRYDARGAPVGGQFQVNSYTMSKQFGTAVAADDQGDFVVVWTSDGSYGTDTSGYSVQGQRFATPIFADGFESSDTSAWSATVP